MIVQEFNIAAVKREAVISLMAYSDETIETAMSMLIT